MDPSLFSNFELKRLLPTFSRFISKFRSQCQGEQSELFTMDAASYSEPNLKPFGNDIKWISRVPETIKAVQELIENLLPEQFKDAIKELGKLVYGGSNEFLNTI
jgi:transposase